MENNQTTEQENKATGGEIKTLWVERAEARKEATNNALNIALVVRNGEKLHKHNATTETATSHTYKIESEAVKTAFKKDFGVNIDNLIKSQKDTETAVFLKITAVNQMRKYAKENLAKFL